jgi:hypothetical protein
MHAVRSMSHAASGGNSAPDGCCAWRVGCTAPHSPPQAADGGKGSTGAAAPAVKPVPAVMMVDKPEVGCAPRHASSLKDPF